MATPSKDPDISDEVPSTVSSETDPGVPLENSVFCSVSGVPLASSSSETDRNVSALTHQIKVENIEDENENYSADVYPETRGESSSTTIPERDSGVRLESSVFCAVRGLPLAGGSASSTGHDVPTLMQQIKVENTKDEDLPAAPYLETSHHGSYETSFEHCAAFPQRMERNLAYGPASIPKPVPSTSQDVTTGMVKIKEEMTEDLITSPESSSDSRWHYSPGANPSPGPSGTSIFPEDNGRLSVEDNLSEENGASKKHQEIDFMETSEETEASYLGTSHHGLYENSFEQCLAFPQRINRKLAYSSPSIPKPGPSTSQDVTNKDLNEDPIRFPESSLARRWHFSPGANPCATPTRGSIFPEDIISLKKEDNLSEEKGTSKKTGQLDFTEASKKTEGVHYRKNTLITFCEGDRFQSFVAPADNVTCETGNKPECLDVPTEKSSDPHSQQCSSQSKHAHASDVSSVLVSPSVSCSSKKKDFPCDQCSARFGYKHHLRDHLLVHTNERAFPCDHCSARFKRKEYLKQHLLSHSNEKAFPCDHCSARFNRKSCLKQHMVVHSSEKAFSCNQCPAQFKRRGSLQDHLLVHSDEKAFPCDQCSARFKCKSLLKVHSVVHSSEKPFSCQECSAQFKKKIDLRTHSLIHSNKRAFSCDQCSAQFKQKAHLQSHLLTHSDTKDYCCDQCFAQFKRKGDLQKHLVTHTDERAFPCEQCSARFKSKSHLRNHLLIHSNEKAFSCNLCPARFAQKYNLNKHLLVHSNEKAFSCDQCSAQFKQKAHLQDHYLTHYSMKAFPCHLCSSQFTRKSVLTKHLLIHSNERLFACDRCPARYNSKSSLWKHSTVHS